jgi:hypothetical protein
MVHYRIAPSNHKEDVVAFLKQMRSRYPFDKLAFRLLVSTFLRIHDPVPLVHHYTPFRINEQGLILT